MHTITITSNIHDAVEWAVSNLDNADWELEYVDFFTTRSSYRFKFKKMAAASHFALRWKDA